MQEPLQSRAGGVLIVMAVCAKPINPQEDNVVRRFATPCTLLLVSLIVLACSSRPTTSTTVAVAAPLAEQDQIVRGRALVLNHGCGDCHGGFDNPAAPGFLAGMMSQQQEFTMGPFKTRLRNMTPDNATGIGRFTERQIFNSLRYGLRPGETPDVEITSTTPGQGNFPQNPKYLAPPMPWFSFRHMSDQELRDIAAYLKRGLKPVSNKVPDSDGPPDFWASEYAKIVGTHPAPAFPTSNEVRP